MRHCRIWGSLAILLSVVTHITAQGAAVGYSPAQIRHAYGFDQLTADGTGQTIGIVAPYGNPYIQTDLDTFCAAFGLAGTTIQVLGDNSNAAGVWMLPAAAAVEWAHVIAPNARIVFSVAASIRVTNDVLYAVSAAVNAGSSVVLMGLAFNSGTSEYPGLPLLDSYFQTPGVTYVAPSGDNGELNFGNETEVTWPASSPYVVSVGGTSLYLDANGNRVSETAWPGSGGGLSTLYETPTWQAGWSLYQKRGVPDVSYVADPNTGFVVYASAYGGWSTNGGTTIGAAQWAALIALANQSRSSGLAGNRDIYKVAGSAPNINANFLDFTSGSNGADPDDLSVPGYDLVTGLGSPVAASLVPALAALPVSGDFSLSVTPTNQGVAQKGTADYTVTTAAVDGFSDPVVLGVSGLPADASFAFTPPQVTGSGQATLSITAGVTSGSFSIIGTGGGITHVAPAASLTVFPPDFSISASPASASVKHGGSLSYNITVASLYGFTGSVTFSAAVSPTVANGPAISFKPQQINGGSGSSQLTVKTVGNTVRGSYTITITGTNGATSHSSTVSLTVN